MSLSGKSPITKIEEQRGLQYIRQVVVPSMVARWNKAVSKSKLRNKESYKLTVEDINKTLVKKQHYIASPGDTTRQDWISFESIPIKPFKFKGAFQFSLLRDNFVGELTVAAALPGTKDFIQFYIEMKVPDTELNVPPVKRGQNLKESKNTFDPITKIEEQRAFQYIKDTLVPRAVESYNSNPKTERKVTADEIRRVLKKTSATDYATTDEEGPYFKSPTIEYFARLKEPNSNLSYVFGFTITRAGKDTKKPGGIMVHCRFPVAAMCGAYLQESIDESNQDDYYKKDMKNALPITKTEELAALDYIKKIMIPSLIRHYDQYSGSHLYEPISADTIRQHLKKKEVRHETGNPALTVVYVSNIPSKVDKDPVHDKNFKFFITKDENNNFFIRWKHPFNFSAGHYISDKHGYYVHTDYDKSNFKIEESKASLKISKKEEMEALQFIREQVIPEMVKTFFVKTGDNLHASEVRSALKKKTMATPEQLATLPKLSDYITYQSWIQRKEGEVPIVINFFINKSTSGEITVKWQDSRGNGSQNYPIGFVGETLTESVESRTITKIEEAELLQNIRTHVIPVAAFIWNQVVKNRRKWEKFGVASEQISRNLIKCGHAIHVLNDKTTTDVIQYKSLIEKTDFQFTFVCHKSVNYPNTIIVMIVFPNGDSKFVNVKGGLISETKLTKITRHFQMNEAGEGIRAITKIEESRVLQQIRNNVVSYVAFRWNSKYKDDRWKNSKITAEEISKNLKKIGHGIHAQTDDPTKADVLRYISSIAESSAVFHLDAYKRLSDNRMIVHVQFPDGDHIHVDPEEGGLTENKKNTLIPIPERCQMTRRDTAEALQFIRQFAIPYLVEFYNGKIDFAPELEVDEILKNLKMIEKKQATRDVLSIKHGSDTVISVPFECVVWKSIGKKIIIFNVCKDFAGKMMLQISMNQIHSSPTEIGKDPILFESVDYTEPPDESNLPSISKKEEMEALQYIRSYILPMAVKYHNGVNQRTKLVSEKDVQKNLRLAGRYPSHDNENPSIAFVSTPNDMYFAFQVHKQTNKNVEDYGKLYVRFRTPDALSPHEYYVGTPPLPISEGIRVKHGAAPRLINKIEENEALQYIRNILVPAAFRCYNNHVMGEYRIRNEDDIRKLVQKVDVEYTPENGYETIYYKASVPTVGGNRVQNFTFYTRRTNKTGMFNRIHCGVTIENYVSQEFYVGDPAYMT